ncbi:hypothetical protein J6590_095575 [Homalodisca vitripennis]|nr:hypothetical protein J6590_095575 [Homalodisca vitripennis]
MPLNRRLSEFLNEEQKNRSTIDAVNNLFNYAVDGLERREHVLSTFPDLSKALIIAKLHTRESCRLDLKILTLPSLYILDTFIFFRSKCDHIRGSEIHSYETRGREDYRTGRHRTVVHKRLPSQVGVHLVNRLPNSIKSVPMLKAFKASLKKILIAEAFYNTDEFMTHDWENALQTH